MNPTPKQITECDDEKQLCEWRRCIDELPNLEGLKSYQSSIECIVCTDDGQVMPARYSINKYAKTEKGKQPRWEWNGRICPWEITYWMPLPKPPFYVR